jgi:hypothetical protein
MAETFLKWLGLQHGAGARSGGRAQYFFGKRCPSVLYRVNAIGVDDAWAFGREMQPRTAVCLLRMVRSGHLEISHHRREVTDFAGLKMTATRPKGPRLFKARAISGLEPALHCGKTFYCSCAMLVIAFARGREESIMTFTIHASKDGHLVQTLRLKPQAAVSKARSLNKAGWEVHITNSQGASFSPPMFGELLQPGDDAGLAPDRATLVVLSDDTTKSAMLS